MFVDENCIPCGWIRGRPSSHSNSKTIKAKNRKWYTDGQTNILLQIQEEIPLGFVLGRTRSEQEKINNAIFNKLMGDTKITITNGHIIKKHNKDEPIPDGYVKGMKLHKKNKPYNNKNDEKWTYVESTELYLSSQFEVLSIGNRILKQHTSNKGVFVNYKGKKVYLHELICKLQFNYNSNLHDIIHVNGNIYDNDISNLQIKMKDTVKIETINPVKKCNSKLTEKDVLGIREMLKTAQSISSIANLYGVHRNSISDIKFNRSWKTV